MKYYKNKTLIYANPSVKTDLKRKKSQWPFMFTFDT